MSCFWSSCHGDPKYCVKCDVFKCFIVLVDDELMEKCCFYFRMMAYVVCPTAQFRNRLQTPWAPNLCLNQALLKIPNYNWDGAARRCTFNPVLRESMIYETLRREGNHSVNGRERVKVKPKLSSASRMIWVIVNVCSTNLWKLFSATE